MPLQGGLYDRGPPYRAPTGKAGNTGNTDNRPRCYRTKRPLFIGKKPTGNTGNTGNTAKSRGAE